MSAKSLVRGGGWGWRAPFALALLLLAVAAPPRPAAADDDPYTATITVDATSDSVATARDMARADGARRALNAIVDRLSGGTGKSKPLKLSDNQVTDLVASFEVANEKMTAVRYTADYTFHFRPAETKRTLQSAGVAINEANPPAASPPGQTPGPAPGGGKPVVVLPVYQSGASAVLWEEPNPWRQAWSQRPAGGGATYLTVPLGDAGDVAAIDADKARSGDVGALAAIAKLASADEVLVMLAVQRPGKDQTGKDQTGGDKPGGDKPGLDVTVRRYRGAQLVDVHADSIDANPGEKDADFFRRAADAIAADIDTGWKNAKDNLAGQQGSLVVAAPITGLDDWLKLRDRLAGLPPVRKIDVKSLSRQEASIDIHYAGTLDQLKASLATIKLDLQGGDPNWRLARTP
ncbi:MAG TPA: DUF2066 domain-containing protein [Stellaceae bacterium]|nr:DUF2066 domain-containing protein [Stellaceae bacterium]